VQFELLDLLDLALLRLAKLGRRKLAESTPEQNRAFYDAFFTATDESVRWSHLDPRRQVAQQVLCDAVVEYVPEGSSIVEIGCGLGDNLLMLAGRWHLTGIDYSACSTQIAARRLAGGAHIVNGSATALPIASNTAGGVLCLEVLEHLQDDKTALREIHRVLAPQGVLIASVPYRHWFQAYFHLMGHYRHYARPDFEELLRITGFHVLDHLRNYPRWHRMMNYSYITCRVLAQLSQLARSPASPVDVRLPGSSRRLIDWFTERLLPLYREEHEISYSGLETSTFLVAAKCS
jgi:ubiquinone/menaquinone biosynthesis C-methylase UbiE